MHDAVGSQAVPTDSPIYLYVVFRTVLHGRKTCVLCTEVPVMGATVITGIIAVKIGAKCLTIILSREL